LYGVQEAFQGSLDVFLDCLVHGCIQSAHLRVQVFAQSNLLDKVFPHLLAAFVRSCAVGVTNGLCKEPALDLFDTGFTDSEEVLRLLAVGIGTVSLGELAEIAQGFFSDISPLYVRHLRLPDGQRPAPCTCHGLHGTSPA
jgi:hypothetical protein